MPSLHYWNYKKNLKTLTRCQNILKYYMNLSGSHRFENDSTHLAVELPSVGNQGHQSYIYRQYCMFKFFSSIAVHATWKSRMPLVKHKSFTNYIMINAYEDVFRL